MNVKDAVKIAIEYVADVFSSENPENLGLEEVVLNEATDEWEITIGFSRPWDYPRPGVMTSMQPQHPKRQYKVVTVEDETGEVKSIKIRDMTDA